MAWRRSRGADQNDDFWIDKHGWRGHAGSRLGTQSRVLVRQLGGRSKQTSATKIVVVAALEKLDKADVLRTQQEFDDLSKRSDSVLKRSERRHCQDVTDCIRAKVRKWSDLRQLYQGHLHACFLLECAATRTTGQGLDTSGWL